MDFTVVLEYTREHSRKTMEIMIYFHVTIRSITALPEYTREYSLRTEEYSHFKQKRREEMLRM